MLDIIIFCSKKTIPLTSICTLHKSHPQMATTYKLLQGLNKIGLSSQKNQVLQYFIVHEKVFSGRTHFILFPFSKMTHEKKQQQQQPQKTVICGS